MGMTQDYAAALAAPFKIRPDYFFLAFTTNEHLGNPRIAIVFFLYQIVRFISSFSWGIIQDQTPGRLKELPFKN